jgi:ABC-2 type transport system ATP-binding protein
LIEVEHLSKYFGRTTAVADISFRVEKGEILGFLGPNGAGKTTTMRILTCFLPASAGTARVAGYDVFTDSLAVRKRIGYLPENPPVYSDMTVRYFLEFNAKIKGIEPKQQKNRAEAVMERCALQEVKETIIGKLSRGYKQRVGLAQALIHDPEVLILDEPTMGLDPRQIIEVRQLIKELGGDHTIILSTHILPEVSVTCERVVIINKGKIAAVDTPENLTVRLKGSEKIYLEVEGPVGQVEQKLKQVPDVTAVSVETGGNGKNSFFVESETKTDIRSQLAAAITGSGFGLLEMRRVGLSLEEIFLQLTTEEAEG